MVRTVKKPEERRDEIIELATKLFWKNDYEKTSMNQIVKELGIAKGTVYHYFSSKEELMFAVIEKEIAGHVKMIAKKMTKAPSDAVEKFLYLIAIGQQSDQSKIDHLHKPGNNILHTRFLARIVSEFAVFYEQVIREGCEQGVFHVEHPLEVAEIMLCSTFIVDIGIYPWSEKDLKRRMKALPSVLEAQLGAKKGALRKLAKLINSD